LSLVTGYASDHEG